jgi:hypothetical protein
MSKSKLLNDSCNEHLLPQGAVIDLNLRIEQLRDEALGWHKRVSDLEKENVGLRAELTATVKHLALMRMAYNALLHLHVPQANKYWHRCIDAIITWQKNSGD